MIREVRERYNAEFTAIDYQRMLDEINRRYENALDFRVCETPLFLTKEMNSLLQKAAETLLNQLKNTAFTDRMNAAIPSELYVENEPSNPPYIAIDFAITEDANGRLTPQLIELQAFATTFCFERMLDGMMKEYLPVPEHLTSFYHDNAGDSFLAAMKRLFIADSHPENVVLLDIQPETQKTRVDFVITEKELGIKPVCVTKLIRRGNRLYYRSAGKEIPIDRIYNRLIVDEFDILSLPGDYIFGGDLHVEWISHPNWFFKISKYCMPFLSGDCVPDCKLLSEVEAYPENLEDYVLKPLFSFAGSGVEIDVTPEKLNAVTDRSNYILQEKVNYASLLQTPSGAGKVEVRMVYFWEDEPQLMQNHVRVSRGKMMGVDFNKGADWIGSTIAYHADLME